MATSNHGRLATVALCCALASGAASAGITTGNNPSVNLIAINVATGAWYVRDTGYLMNAFMPANFEPLPADGPVTGTITPNSGLHLDQTNATNFADPGFSTWLSQQSPQDVRWMLSSADRLTSTTDGRRRLITSSAVPLEERVRNIDLDNYTNSPSGAGRLDALTGSFGLSTSGVASLSSPMFQNFTLGTDTLARLDTSADLYYLQRLTLSGLSGAYAAIVQYGNEAGYATVTLESDGDLVYHVPEVLPTPLPAAAWLLVAGLAGGVATTKRRRNPELAAKTP